MSDPRRRTPPGPPVLSRRRLLQLAGAGAAAAALPGCAGSGPGATWQAIPSYSLQGTDPVRVGYLQEQLARFRSESELGIDPQVSSADTAAAMSRLLLQASQGRAPDVAQVDGYVFGRIAEYARSLDEAARRYDLRLDDWFPSLRPVVAPDGSTIRSLQFTSDVRVLYHRLDVVPEPPATWDELVEVARPLAERGQHVLFPAGRSEGAVATTLWPQFWNSGLDLFDESGEPTFGDGPGHDAMRDALGVVERCVTTGVTPSRVATFDNEDAANADVVAGRASMFVGGSWQAATLDNALEGESFFDTWGVAPLPSLTGERHVTTAGGWTWAGFAEDPEVLATGVDWVVRAFVGDEGMAAWCTAGGYLPPRRSVYDHPAYEQNPFTPVFREHLAELSRTRPSARRYLEVSSSMQIALSAVAAGSTDAEAGLDQALARLV